MQHLRRSLARNSSFKLLNQKAGSRSFSSNKLHDVGQPTHSTHPELLKEGEITPGITSEEFISRRKRLLELLPKNSLAIVAAAPVKMMTDVVPYTFRQDADYLYITGCQQPGGIAVLSHDFGLCMFMPEATPVEVAWQGQIAGVEAALDTFKAEQSYPISQLPKILPDMIKRSSRLFHNVKTAAASYMDLEAFQKAFYGGKVTDFSKCTHEARWIKSPAELKLMRDSASVGCQALLRTMLHSRLCPCEGILSAKVEYECRLRGAQRMAFNPVVGGGPNGSVVHYSRNDQKIKDGELVLMDIGCELHGYVSDLTRTWPPCGRFSAVHCQELLAYKWSGSATGIVEMSHKLSNKHLEAVEGELYELILETNKECVKLCEPGVSIRYIHNYSVDKLQKGLKEIGILKDNTPHIYNQLNPTNIGHYLGLDVHDCTTISYDRTLKPGVVITIEPGVYIPSNFDCPERYQGIGIRIEDEVLITESGHEVLTGSLPKEINHIESLLSNYSHMAATETGEFLRAASY